MPKFYSTIEQFWLSPKGDELWMKSSGCGLLRAKLASGEVTQYVKSDCADSQGRVHAAWCVKEETYTAIVTDLVK
jgi:hypothetical protein